MYACTHAPVSIEIGTEHVYDGCLRVLWLLLPTLGALNTVLRHM